VLTIITKPTENCNANCVYCSVNDKSKKKEVMSVSVLTAFYERIRDYLSGTEETVNITWHGGEPLLPGTDYYEEVIRVQEKILGSDQSRVSHSMQSNLTMLHDGFRKIFERLGIDQVGSSFEFVPHLRGIGKTVDSELYEDKFFEAIAKLKQWGVRYGVVYVVTSRSVDRNEDVLNYLMNLIDRQGTIRLNPLYLEGEARREEVKPLGIDESQFGHFLGHCFQSWFPRRDYGTPVQPFDGFYKYVTDQSRTLCCDESGVCGYSHLGIDPQGNIYQCGRAMDSHVLKFGNLETHDFKSVFNHDLKRQLNDRSSVLRERECRDCRFFDFCHGGCPIDGFIYRSDWFKKTIWCEARKIFLEKYFEPTLNLQLKSE
jgi:uncharacterized protein